MYKINNLKILIVGLTSVLALANFNKDGLKEIKAKEGRTNLSLCKN
ncbi:hypothetical protein GJU43_17925 [Flavobacterium sp. LC2016-23]|nr:hypothetical protein [Flavobacterium sp. LC2016-23]MRX41168.1 hypothetical protein [Flavobacterium sp. LC2016-23]